MTPSEPLPALPGIPTAKATLPGFEVLNWYGMSVRAGTPQAASAAARAERMRSRSRGVCATVMARHTAHDRI